jgi:polyphosphate kinase 2 (PPK2 family)
MSTHTPWAPWHIVPADDKRRARLNLIRHLLDSIANLMEVKG